MHVLHLPRHSLWRITAIAAVLAVLLTAILLPAVDDLASSSGSAPAGSPSWGAVEPVRPPLAPRTVFNEPLQNPLVHLGPAVVAR